MATLQEEQSIVTQAEAPTALRQDIELVSPVISEGNIQGNATQSKDIQSLTTKQETALSMAEKWHHYTSFVIDKTKTQTDNLLTIHINAWTCWEDCPLPFVLNRDDTSKPGTLTQGLVKYDAQIKFTIYSSSQQQGAIIFAMLPFPGEVEDYFAYQQGVKAIFDANDMTQFQHRIISLGRDTEYIMTVPFMSKFTMQPSFDDTDFGRVKVYMFDPLQCLEGTFDKVNVRVEIRLINIQTTGPKFRDGFKLTQYGA